MAEAKNFRLFCCISKYYHYVCSANSYSYCCPTGIRLDAQYEIGLFLCPSVSFSWGHENGIHIRNLRLSFPTSIPVKDNTV